MVRKQLWLSYNNAEENFSDSGEIVEPSKFWEHKQLQKKERKKGKQWEKGSNENENRLLLLLSLDKNYHLERKTQNSHANTNFLLFVRDAADEHAC